MKKIRQKIRSNLLKLLLHQIRSHIRRILAFVPLLYVETEEKIEILVLHQTSVLTIFQYPAIKNAPLPADGAGNETFSNAALISLLAIIPWYFSRQVGGGLITWIFFAMLTAIPILVSFWAFASSMSPRKNDKARFPGAPVEHYLNFRDPAERAKYHGKNKIPMHTFHEMYFNNRVDFNGDALEVLEYRHDWASFRFTLGLVWYFFTRMIPETIMHSRSQGT